MATLSSGLPEVVGDDEDLARFLTSSSHYNSIMVKPTAFLPNPKDGTTSVCRHGDKPREVLWQIAAEHVVGDRNLHGAAIVRAGAVRAIQLDVLANEPPPRHAEIVGWPELASDPDLQKAHWKLIAAEIAGHATLVRR